jgi:hypothetical protein
MQWSFCFSRTGISPNEPLTVDSKNDGLFSNGTGLSTSFLLDLQMLYASNLATATGPQGKLNARKIKSIVSASHAVSMRLKLAVRNNAHFRHGHGAGGMTDHLAVVLNSSL